MWLLSDDELAQVIAWIEAGAPEKPGTATPPPTTATTEGWVGGIDQLVNAKCAACHVNASLGELSLKTYADALKGGKSGPAACRMILTKVLFKFSRRLCRQLAPEEPSA
jgi:hypothetical protein